VVMLRGTGEPPLRRLWSDIEPATVCSAAMALVAVSVSLALNAARVPPVPWLLALTLAAAPAYLLTLRACYPAVWRGQCAILEQILPAHRRLLRVRRRLAAEAAAH